MLGPGWSEVVRGLGMCRSMLRGSQWLLKLGLIFDSIQDECEAPTQ